MNYLLQFFKTENISARKIEIEIEILKYNLFLPPILKLFYTNYPLNLKIYRDRTVFGFYHKITNSITEFAGPTDNDLREKGYLITTFYDFEYFRNVIADFFNDDYLNLEKEFICIGETEWRFPLLIGISSSNIDKVYVYNMDDDRLEFLTENIFEYFFLFEFTFSTFNFPEGKQLSDLYKNWSEDFWRIRDLRDVTSNSDLKDKEISDLKTEKDKYYYKLKALARAEKKGGMSLDVISEKYGFSVEELGKSFF
jgi:hypothetical protein